MIIKSLGRKSRTRAYGRRRSDGMGRSAFADLARYMNRGIEEEEGQAVLWHNFPGGETLEEDALVAEFEGNARDLRERKNGNVLYHEILSFSRIDGVERSVLSRHIADIGQVYLDERAPTQLAYGVIHYDTEHIHLHLMVSANAIRSRERVRLSKRDFAEVQRNIEAYTIERFPELKQTVIYDKSRELRLEAERVKASASEQAMHAHRGVRARKIDLAQRLHQAFAQARTAKELATWCQRENIRFYERGKSVGIIVTEPDGRERRHRLSTLGVLKHYEQTNERLTEREGEGPVFKQERDQVRDGENGTVETQETVTTKVKARVDEELRFGKEVLKDFIFGVDREDRRANHEKPPEPKKPREPRYTEQEWREREAKLESLREARAQGQGVDRDEPSSNSSSSESASSANDASKGKGRDRER